MITQTVNTENIKQEKIEDQAKPERTCANCACFHHVPNPVSPSQNQGMCRLNPPQHKRVRVEVPRMRLGQSVMGKDGKPVMEIGEADALFYAPMTAEMVCFDGWRPIGTEPGERWELKRETGELMARFNDAMQWLSQPMEILGVFATTTCSHGMPVNGPCSLCPGQIASASFDPVDDDAKTN